MGAFRVAFMQESPNILLGVCSDTHGGALPVWNGVNIAAVLHAGDIYDAPTLIEDDDDPLPRQWVESLGVPVLAVRGNHDYRDPGRFFRAAEDISGNLRRPVPRLWIAGIGFAPGGITIFPVKLIWMRNARTFAGDCSV